MSKPHQVMRALREYSSVRNTSNKVQVFFSSHREYLLGTVFSMEVSPDITVYFKISRANLLVNDDGTIGRTYYTAVIYSSRSHEDLPLSSFTSKNVVEVVDSDLLIRLSKSSGLC